MLVTKYLGSIFSRRHFFRAPIVTSSTSRIIAHNSSSLEMLFLIKLTHVTPELLTYYGNNEIKMRVFVHPTGKFVRITLMSLDIFNLPFDPK